MSTILIVQRKLNLYNQIGFKKIEFIWSNEFIR